MPVRVWLEGDSYALQACSGAPLPLGAIIAVRQDALAAAGWTEQIVRLALAAPWAPVVADREAFTHLRAVLPAGSRLLRSRHGAPRSGGARVTAPPAIAALDAPTVEDLLEHLDARLGPVRAPLVRSLFAEWGGDVRTHRSFRRHGLPTPHDWYDLWLQLFAQRRTATRETSEAAAARLRGISVRELIAQSYRLYQLSWQESGAMPWTARVEAFLRLSGLCRARSIEGVRRSRFNDVRLRRVGNRAGPGTYVSSAAG